jgi:hypothetical protein
LALTLVLVPPKLAPSHLCGPSFRLLIRAQRTPKSHRISIIQTDATGIIST